jgi:hypothetical protein
MIEQDLRDCQFDDPEKSNVMKSELEEQEVIEFGNAFRKNFSNQRNMFLAHHPIEQL